MVEHLDFRETKHLLGSRQNHAMPNRRMTGKCPTFDTIPGALHLSYFGRVHDNILSSRVPAIAMSSDEGSALDLAPNNTQRFWAWQSKCANVLRVLNWRDAMISMKSFVVFALLVGDVAKPAHSAELQPATIAAWQE